MLFTPEPPELADDAYVQQVSAEPTVGELGVHTFGRSVADHLTVVLDLPVAPPLYRENRWDQRDLPKASTFTMTLGTHTVLISMFEVKHALIRGTMPAYAIHLNGIRVPFELANYRDVEWQLARTIWIAVDKLNIAESDAAGGARL